MKSVYDIIQAPVITEASIKNMQDRSTPSGFLPM